MYFASTTWHLYFIFTAFCLSLKKYLKSLKVVQRSWYFKQKIILNQKLGYTFLSWLIQHWEYVLVFESGLEFDFFILLSIFYCAMKNWLYSWGIDPRPPGWEMRALPLSHEIWGEKRSSKWYKELLPLLDFSGNLAIFVPSCNCLF